MALTEKQIKSFKKAEANAEDGDDFRRVADEIAEAGDKEWAKQLYKKAEAETDDSSNFYQLANSVGERLGDKVWAKKIYKKLESEIESIRSNYIVELCELAGNLCKQLGDKAWAKKLYKKAEHYADAEDDKDYNTIADGLCEILGDKAGAKKLYKKGEAETEKSEEKSWEFLQLAESLCGKLGDKGWAKKTYKRALAEAKNTEDSRNIADSIKYYLEDDGWAEDIINNSNESLTDGDLAKYLKWKPTKIQAHYIVWVSEKEEGIFTTDKGGKKIKVEGYKIWNNKSGVTLNWKLPKSKGKAIKTLGMETWKSDQISYDEFEGFESSEGKGSSNYDSKGKELKKVKKFSGNGDTEIINFGSELGPSEIKIDFKGNKEMIFSIVRLNWTVVLEDGQRSLENYSQVINVIKKVIS